MSLFLAIRKSFETEMKCITCEIRSLDLNLQRHRKYLICYGEICLLLSASQSDFSFEESFKSFPLGKQKSMHIIFLFTELQCWSCVD
jgi:hypothetical protein